MELDDGLVTLGLSSCDSDLRTNGTESFESIEGMESRMDGFCVLNPYLGI